MSVKIEVKDVEKLSNKQIDFMNKYRIKEYGKGSDVDFKKEDKKGKFFFVKDNGKVMAFGMLKPVSINYLGKKYNIFGIGRGLAIKKGKGYGKDLGLARINYLKKESKTGLAFTERKNIGFFEKVGFKIKKNFIRRFRYKCPLGKIIKDNDGDGIYYEGKDKLISKMLSTKSVAYINVPFW